MNLDYSIFSIVANVAPNGVFGILDGGLEVISSKSWPAMIPTLTLLARFSFDPEECGKEYPCVVKVTSPDGALLIPNLVVVLKPGSNIRHPEQKSSFVAIYRYTEFSFQKPGFHRFDFFIGEAQVGEARLEAVERPA